MRKREFDGVGNPLVLYVGWSVSLKSNTLYMHLAVRNKRHSG